MAKISKVTRSFNSGELSPLMDSRSDQAKYDAGAKTMENFIPLLPGAAKRRPGLEYIANAKSSTAASKSNLIAFEHSVDDTYILEFANQVIRVFKNGAQVTSGSGSEDLSALDNVLAHWKLNDSAANTVVVDADGATHNGVASSNTEDITVAGKVGSGAFNLNGTDAVAVDDHADFTFVEGVDGDFTLSGWVRVTESGTEQMILTKWDETIGSQGREWKLSLGADRKLKMVIADESLLLDTDLVAHWKMNDSASNATVIDATGNHDGTLTDGDSNNTSDHSVASKSGSNMVSALNFDGTNDKVTVDNSSDFNFGNSSSDSPFSISAWINMDDATNFTIIDKRNPSNNLGEWEFLCDGNDKLTLRIGDNDMTTAFRGRRYDTALTGQQGSWIHVVATYDATEASSGITLYLNGSAVDDADSQGGGYVAMHPLSFDVRIGVKTRSSTFADGKIDNVMIFDKELSQTEVTALYNGGDGIEELGTRHPSATTDDVLETGWRYIVMTYEGENGSWTGATAANFIKMYVDSAEVDVTATNESAYAGMEDTAAKLRIGAQESTAGAIEKIWASQIDNMAVFGDVLTPEEVASLFDATTVYEITTPYLTADLFSVKFGQSADVMFITHPDYEPRRLSRFNDDDWILSAEDLQTGPFRDQNTDTTKTITASATTGSVTLTAVGHAPFIASATAGHVPSGSAATSKSQTGALFKLVHASNTPSISGFLVTNNATNNSTSELAVPKGVTWDLTTNGTWGTASNSATIQVQREYGNNGVWEAVATITSAANRNLVTSGTEEVDDAQYRVSVTEAGGDTSEVDILLSIRDTSHIGIVQITSVSSPTSATGTVVKTLGSTDKTHRWSEGSFSNLRGWPIDVTISAEERLTFAGNVSEPLTVWGSVIGDFTNFALGVNDDDAIQFTLVGTGQQNRIRWMIAKEALVLGTVGGEHLLGASKQEEALTPTNVKAKIQTTYGSEDIAAIIINQAVLFVQRGGKKIREFLYSFEADSHRADDLTVFSDRITNKGIVDMAFQRTPDPTLWCVRADGQLAILTYERDQNVFSWYRAITNTNLAGTSTASVVESVAVIFGGARSEDEVWVSVLRQINGTDARYIERYRPRLLPDSASDYRFLDSSITKTPSGTTVSGLDHLEGQTVQVLGDGEVQTETTAGDFIVGGGLKATGVITVPSGITKAQCGIGYGSILVPMDLDIEGTGRVSTKRINKVFLNVFDTIGGTVGPSSSEQESIGTGKTLFTGFKQVSIGGGYSRDTDITIKQTDPLPMTVLSIDYEVGASVG